MQSNQNCLIPVAGHEHDRRFFLAGNPPRPVRTRQTERQKAAIQRNMKRRMDELFVSCRDQVDQGDFKMSFGPSSQPSPTSPFPIDAVFTWVQSTPAHMERLRSYDAIPSDNGRNRYNDNEELRFAIRSIHANAPWFRRICIVVDDTQCPEWLSTECANTPIPTVVVPHSLIYGEQFRSHLPTFNSQSIETHLHCIPGLAEHFVYFNDDMFVGERVSWTHFFTPQKLPKYTFTGFVQTGPRTEGMCKHSVAWINNGKVLDKMFPRTIGQPRKYPAHQCVAMLRSSFEEVWNTQSHYLNITSASKFRDNNNMYLVGFLALYNLYNHQAVEAGSATLFVQIKDSTDVFNVAKTILTRHPTLFCINDGVKSARSTKGFLVRTMLQNLFPEPSAVENSR
jgi:hypothetical protein